MSIPVLDLSWASDPSKKPQLLEQLHAALFDVGFLYITNHGVPRSAIDRLTALLPPLFDLSDEEKAGIRKLNSPHFVGYNGYAEEVTLGQQDLREQFDFASELPQVWQDPKASTPNQQANSAVATYPDRDFTKLYWRLYGSNQWPPDSSLPGFRAAFTAYHDALAELSYRFVHLIEEAFGIPVGIFDHFFGRDSSKDRTFLSPQHRIKLLRYPPTTDKDGQGVGPHKDSSGWLTFLYQVGHEPGLEVLSADGEWIAAKPIDGTFVVNFGNAFEAATEGAVKATTHRVVAPRSEADGGRVRYSIPFFMGLPLDMTVSEIQSYIPAEVRRLRKEKGGGDRDSFISSYLDPRWDSLGESNLRKWIRSHKDVGEKWYGKDVVDYYTQ